VTDPTPARALTPRMLALAVYLNDLSRNPSTAYLYGVGDWRAILTDMAAEVRADEAAALRAALQKVSDDITIWRSAGHAVHLHRGDRRTCEVGQCAQFNEAIAALAAPEPAAEPAAAPTP